MKLGTNIEAALRMIGLTSERVEAWLGRPCGCKERVEKLDQLGMWAKRVLRAKTQSPHDELEGILKQP
jgi:hypothetical protein